MDPQRWERVKELFESALSRSGADRSTYLASACDGDRELRGEVAALLGAHEQAPQDFLAQPLSLVSAADALAGEGSAPETADASGGAEAATSAAHTSFAAGEIVAGRYRIERFLARGGMGEVYAARDLVIDASVAVKTLRLDSEGGPHALRRFKREALLARTVRHRNVCRVHDLHRHRTGARVVSFLTMELLLGETLRERISSRSRLTTDEALPIVGQMTAGLAASHAAGILHRDFKSSNVMLVPAAGGERAVITDFGLARATCASDEETTSTRFIGTPAYMAPEQVLGLRLGPAADVYALGVVLYQMVTGTLPFAGPTALATAVQRLGEAPPAPRSLVPELDPRWESVILRCLERAPEARFVRVEDVMRALEGRLPDETARAGERARRRHSSLPAELDEFFGRQEDLEALARRFDQGVRLVTLVGPAGAGKTRLAVRYAAAVETATWPGGIWFADLGEARSLEEIASTVAAALSVPPGPGDPVARLGVAIAARGRCLILLDHFEQIVKEGSASVGAWLERAPEACFLVTSRERLSQRGEALQKVDPLDEATALELFAARASAQRPGFSLGEGNLAAVREIARLADGLPLAIELAAARVRLLEPWQLLDRMRDRFRLPAAATGSGRHATLEAAIDGSWELLHPWEKAAFAQLAVFEGGFSLAAAEEMLDLAAWPEAPWAIDVVQALLDKSLLRSWVPARAGRIRPSPLRLGMYVSLQEYARKKLRASGAVPDGGSGADAARCAEQRHGAHFAPLGADATVAALYGPGGEETVRELELELNNLTAACSRAVELGDARTALDTFSAALEVLERRGPNGRALALARELLTLSGLEGEASARRGWLVGRSLLMNGRLEEAADHLRDALLPASLSGARCEAGIHGVLGIACRAQGRRDQARAHYIRGLDLARKSGQQNFVVALLSNLGIMLRLDGEAGAARVHYEEALTLARRLGNRIGEGQILDNLGMLHRLHGRMDEARAHFEAALVVHREIDHRRSEAVALDHLGCLHRDQGRMDAARDDLEAALVIGRELGDRLLEGSVWGDLGDLERDLSRADAAAACYETALAISREVRSRSAEGLGRCRLGLLARDHGRTAEAREHLDASLAIARASHDRRAQALAIAGLASLHGRAEDGEPDSQLMGIALSLMREIGDVMALGKLLCCRGTAASREGDVAGARAALREADGIAAACGAGPASELGRATAALRAAIVLSPAGPGG